MAPGRIFASGNQGGKALAFSEPVLTPSGWVPIAELSVGDIVFDEDGAPTSVLGVFPQGEQDIYAVKFDDETEVRCTLDHLWKCVPRDWAKNRGGVKTTAEILKYGETCLPKMRHLIPVTGPVQFQAREVPLDPYLMGALLGDGSFQKTAVGISSADQELVDEVTRLLPQGCYLSKSGKYDYYIRDNGSGNQVLGALRALELNGLKAYEKFIPHCYLYNSPETRLSILQGLLDTDGDVGHHGQVNFCSTSKVLAEQVAFIVQTLGGKCKTRERQTYYTHNEEYRAGRVSYRVRIRLPRTRLFRLTRKFEKQHDPVSTCDERVIRSIKKVGRSEAVCIKVASPKATFLTRGCVVTHNTHWSCVEVARYALGEHTEKKIRVPNTGVLVSGQGFQEGIVKNILPKLESVVGSEDIKAIRKNSQGIPTSILWRTGSVTYLMSSEQDDMAFEGITLDYFAIDEPVRRAIYIALSRGLMKSGGHWWMGATLLDEPWIYEDLIVPAQDGYLKDVEVFIGSSDENPVLSDEEKDRFFGKLSEDELKTRRLGQPSAMQGRVFKSYKPEINRIAPFDIPSHWPVWVSIDPHRNKPHAVLFIACSPRGDLYACNEIFHRCDINELAGIIVDLESQYNVVNRLIDTSAQEDGWVKESAREMLAKAPYLLHTKLAQKKNLKKSGISLLNQLFANAHKPEEPGQKLYVFDTCKRFHRELLYQKYKKNKRDEQMVLEEPEKKFDDQTDNARYIVVERPSFRGAAQIIEHGPLYQRTGGE